MPQNKCKYNGTIIEPQRCPAYGKGCTGCGRANFFEWMNRNASERVMRDTVRETQREVHYMCSGAEETEVSTEEFDMVRLKVFNFHSV